MERMKGYYTVSLSTHLKIKLNYMYDRGKIIYYIDKVRTTEFEVQFLKHFPYDPCMFTCKHIF